MCGTDNQLVQSGDMHKTEEDSEARSGGSDAALSEHSGFRSVLLDAEAGPH